MPLESLAQSAQSDQPSHLAHSVAIIIPIKAFHHAKERLADLLTPTERLVLARFCAQRVISAATGHQVFVVCDDQDVADWARSHNAKIVWQPEVGLNPAVRAGVDAARARGNDLAIVAHSDLPLATGFSHLISDCDSATLQASITLVPDRHEDGTNVLVIPTTSTFEFCYGRNSFLAHQKQASKCGLAVRIVHDHRLAVDIDTAEDLALAQQLDEHGLIN